MKMEGKLTAYRKSWIVAVFWELPVSRIVHHVQYDMITVSLCYNVLYGLLSAARSLPAFVWLHLPLWMGKWSEKAIRHMITFRDVESPPQSPNQEDLEYPNWWSRERLFLYLRTAHLDGWWNYFICLLVLAAIVWVIIEIQDPFIKVIDMGYNIIYGVHVASIVYSTAIHFNKYDMSFEAILRLLMDFVSFLHYAMSIGEAKHFKIFCYYLRFNRPFKYLWALNDYQSQGSVAGTVLKYCYLFFVLRISWALVWFYIFEEEHVLGVAHQFLSAVSLINTMFIPIGPSDNPDNDVERIICMLVMLTGCLVVTGVAVASLSLVISIYLNPDEAFRQRYRLIMKEMKVSKVPSSLGEKVKTFYKMYWHKQKAVSATQLLPTFPPTLPNAIYTDIYFEATQKSRVLRDLSYEFLSKVAMKMDTVLYIPGDTIIKRTTKKSNMIFIAYGDIEMLTAEDDSTAVLRMTCGTSLSGCAGAVPAACVRAYVDIRAATFCITHVISARDLWLLALKHVRYQAQSGVILSSFYEHLDHVKTHYWLKIPEEAKFKSSIYHFKRKLMALNESTDERGNYVLGRKDVFLEIAGSYIMRKRADATLTNESDAICLRPTFPCILQPASSLQIAWHSFISCVIIVVCFTHPYYLVFKKEVPVEFRFFDYVVTLLFVLDLIVHLSTGENVEAGVPITFAQTASQQVRDRWFIFDVVGTVPIFEFIANGHFAGINKLLRLPKAFRMLKTLEEICVYHSSVLRYLYYTLVLLIACYLLAALQQGFMCFHFGHCLVGNFTHKPFWENKTLDRDTEKYDFIFGLYWAISMITFTAHKQAWMENNWNTTVYTMFVLELCIVLRIFIEAAYSADIMVTTALREDYDACIANVKNFLVRNSVDPELRQRFINYLQLCWFTDKAYSMTKKKSSIFHDLPPHVYQDIVVRQRSKYLLSMPFMKLLNQEDLKTVSSKAKLFYTSPNEVLLNTGDISNEMYVIKQGMCEILDPDTKQVVGTLGVKDHFGVVECLLRLPAYYTVRAVTHLQIFSISNKVLSRAMELPRIKDAIEFAKERPEYSRLLRARESFQSYVPPAPAPNIEGFRRPRKYETDYEYLRPFYRLGSFSTLRYIFPRFTIRPDGAYLMRYERFRAVCALLSALVYPGYTYLKMQWPALSHVALLLDCTAYFDMVQRMFVGYFNEVGALVFHPASTAAHYMRGAFIVDLFACLPLEKLESSEWLTWEIGTNVAVIHMTPARQILMLNRLLQLYRLPGAMHNLQGYIERRDILLVLKAMPLFMVLLNSMTSMMVFCSVHVLKVNGALVIKTFEDEGGSWLHLFGNTFRFNLTESPWNLHVATFFWVVYETTSTGFGCFNPSNATLIMVLFMGMIISATVVTYFAVRIISVRANVNKELAEYQQHMKDIVVYMRREDLPHNLRKEVMEYYEHNWDKTGGIDYTSVLKLCDQITLRTDAILHIYGPIFEKCPFLAECDISLLRIIGRAVRSVYYLRGMLLVDVDDVVRDLYIVGDGNVAVKEHANDSTTIAVLSTGSVFGNLENSPAVRYTSAIVAQSTVHVLQINADTFHRIISDFPQVAKDMRALQFEDDNFIMGTTPDGDLPVKGNRSSVLQSFTLRNHKNLSLFFEEKLFQTYLMVISLACVYADVYNAGFQCNTTSFIIFLYTLDFCFYLKILLYYGFPYLTRKLAYSKKSLIAIKQAYLKHEFKYDLISCLPIELIGLFLFDDYNWTVFSWLRLNRMFRMVTAYKCLVRNRERITFNLTFSTVFTVLIWFTLFTHITACLWFFIGMLEDSAKPKSSWIYKDSGESWCDSMYICSVYFVLTTFLQTGVGDIMPKNRAEVIFVSILQIVSTMLYMIYVGEFSNLIQFRSFRSFRYYCKYLELQEFLKNNRVSQNLVTIVNNYSIHLWRESRGMQVPYFLEAAPQSLRLRVMSAAYMTHLTQNPVFKNCEPAFLRQLVGCLRLYTYDEGLYVVRKTEITDSMYMIHSGRVSQLSHDRPFFTAFKCFGMEQGLFHDTPYPYSYITVTKSQVLTLRLGDWEDLLKHFPKCKRTIYKYFNGSDNDFPDEPTAQTGSKEPDKNNDSNITAINTNFSNEPGDMKVLRESYVSSPNINLMNSTVEDVTTTPNVTSLTRLTGSNLSRKESNMAFNTRFVSKSDRKDVNIQTVSKKDKSVEEGKQNVTTNQSNQSVQTLFSLPISIRGSEDIELLTNSKPSLKEIIENKVKGILKKYKASDNYELTRVDSNDVNNLPKEEDETESTNTHHKDTALEDKKTKDETAALSDSKNIADIEYIPEVDLNPEKQQSTVTIKDTTDDTYALVPYKEVKKSSQESRKTSFDDLKAQPGLRIRDDDNDTEKTEETEETRPEDQAGPSSAGISKKNKTDGPDKI